jgi:uncharacterized protein YpuA (DUF1002 family)
MARLEKNIQAYKKKGEVPNTIAAIVTCFVAMHKSGLDYRKVINDLELEAKVKKGAGFAKNIKSDQAKEGKVDNFSE